MLCIAGWWGCAKGSGDTTPASTATTSSSSTTSASAAGGGFGTGGASATSGTGGAGGGHDGGKCTPTSTPATHPPVDIVFTIDQSAAMAGVNWNFVSTALPKFFTDPASVGVSAGLLLFPYSANDCDLNHYKTLTVPVGALPANATVLTNAIPASAQGVGLPMYPALQGALMQATALKDANPTHAVLVVLATNGVPKSCDLDPGDGGAPDGGAPDGGAPDAGDGGPGESIPDEMAALAGSAFSYNGVLTHVICLPNISSNVSVFENVAAAGGTNTVHDLTADVGPLAATLAQIRTSGFGCSYTLPTPPSGKPLDPNEVNLRYTPKGTGMPAILLRAANATGCNGQPGWYYDDPSAPTKMVLCPESCATVQADTSPEVDVLLGCASQLE